MSERLSTWPPTQCHKDVKIPLGCQRSKFKKPLALWPGVHPKVLDSNPGLRACSCCDPAAKPKDKPHTALGRRIGANRGESSEERTGKQKNLKPATSYSSSRNAKNYMRMLNPKINHMLYPIGSIYAIYANIGGILMVNATIYSIHGSYGYV